MEPATGRTLGDSGVGLFMRGSRVSQDAHLGESEVNASRMATGPISAGCQNRGEAGELLR